jgi:hypothetical protein
MMGERVPDLSDIPAEGVPEDNLGGDIPKAELDIAHQRSQTVHVDALHPKVQRRIVTLANHNFDQGEKTNTLELWYGDWMWDAICIHF